MPVYTDQLNRIVEIDYTPKRIISVVPSQTELLYDLGLEQSVVGITKFCVHPEEWFRNKTRVGGTKTLDTDTIRQLKPDLIIANKEENVKDQIELLAKEFPIWISDINNISDALDMIKQVGSITDSTGKSEHIASQIESSFLHFRQSILTSHQQFKTCYLIWKDPYMTVGRDTFIHHLLQLSGFNNVFAHLERYPSVTINDMVAANCELLLLSSEPYPFKDKHIKELQQQLPTAKILLVDGELFSWYGSRLLHTSVYLQQLIQKIAAIS